MIGLEVQKETAPAEEGFSVRFRWSPMVLHSDAERRAAVPGVQGRASQRDAGEGGEGRRREEDQVRAQAQLKLQFQLQLKLYLQRQL